MANPLYDALFAPHEGRKTEFLILPDGTSVTHGAFLARAARFANAIAAAGLVPGDRLAAQLEKSGDALAVYAACVRAGLVFLPLNPAYTDEEVAYFLGNSGARLFLCDPSRETALAPVAAAHGATIATLGADGRGSFAESAAGQSETFATAPRSADDLAALLYTSGTTGRSKGAMLTQRNLLSNAEVLTAFWQFTARDVLIHALPIFHTHGLFVATHIMLLAGGALIFLPKFDTAAVLASLPRATAMMGVPTFYTRLLDDPRLTRELTAHMRLFISGSAPLLAETHRQWEARTGHRILERYGMTETSMNTSNPCDGERRAGTVGLPLPGIELRITDPATGGEVGEGEIGQIEIRGPNVFAGYWGMPEKTREDLGEDGFFRTGDLGRVDADGYLSIVGRSKDLIISGGFNVYPKEIESVLDEQPGVLESAVIGVPHPDLGEGVVAVLATGGGQPDLDAIGRALSGRLARFKQPKTYVIVDELPRNAMGKVQKADLRRKLAGTFGGS